MSARRPGWRHALLGARWLFALGLLAWLAIRLWALHVAQATPREAAAEFGSLDPKRWDRVLPAPRENGARYFRAAGLLLDTTTSAWKRWREPGADESGLAAVEAENAEALALFEAGAGRSACVFYPSPAAAIDAGENLTPLVSLSRLVAALAERDFAGGESRRGSERLLSLVALSDCFGRETTLLPQVLASPPEMRALRGLRSALASGAIDGDLDRWIGALDRLPAPGTKEALLADAVIGLDPRTRPFRFRVRTPSGLDPLAVVGFEPAIYLRGACRAIRELDAETEPAPADGRFPFFRLWAFEGFYAATLVENTWATYHLALARHAERDLALAALRLRRLALASGRYPTSGTAIAELSAPMPWTGERATYTPSPDGGVELSLPALEAALRAPKFHESSTRYDLRWHLPSPPAPAGATTPVR